MALIGLIPKKLQLSPSYERGGVMQPFKPTGLTLERIRSLAVIAVAVITLAAGAAFAADESKTKVADNKPADEPIQIIADQLISDNQEKFADFIGNVVATQADFVINSDKLRIYYRGELLGSEKQSGSNDDMLKKIVATGNVRITSEQYNAEAEEVEYDTAAMTIILTGENSKVISGKNSITGSKIIMYRKEGRVKVESSKSQRVKALFYSEGKASDAFKIEKPKE
jgi:lipopolysaccharide export system protein LptA